MKHAEFTTESGCRVRVFTFDRGTDTGKALITLDMDQPGDGRHAEVLLDPHSVDQLVAGLEKWIASQ